MYKLVLTPEAQRAYERLYYSDREHFKRIAIALEGLKSEPFAGKPLKFEFKGQYSLRVGFYRIIYQVEKRQVMVVVLDIGHRRDIYERK